MCVVSPVTGRQKKKEGEQAPGGQQGREGTGVNRGEAGCSQEEGPKKGFVMGSRTQGVQEILENTYRMSSPPQA